MKQACILFAAAALAATQTACGGGAGNAASDPGTSATGGSTLPAGAGTVRVVVSTAVSVTLPAQVDAAAYELRSAAGAASASAGSVETLSRDIVALSKGGQPVYIGVVRPGAAVEVNARSTAVALVIARLGLAAASDSKYELASKAIVDHVRFADLVVVIESAAGAGMTRPIDTHANPMLAKLIAVIAADVEPQVTAEADIEGASMPRWLAQALFRLVPAGSAQAKTYDNTSAGGEVSVTVDGTNLKVQNFRAVPWVVRKQGAGTWGLATGRQNGLSFGNPVVEMKLPPSLDWSKLMAEGSSVSEVPMSSAGLSGQGSEVLVLEQYTLCRAVVKGVEDAGALGVLPVVVLAQSIKPIIDDPALAESTLFNLLDGVALVSGLAADGRLPSGRGRPQDARALANRLIAFVEEVRLAPCWAKHTKPYVKAAVAIAAGVREGLERRGFANGNKDQQLTLEYMDAAWNALLHGDALIDGLAALPGSCDDAASAAQAKSAFLANFAGELGGALKDLALEDAIPELVNRYVAEVAAAPSGLAAVQRGFELMLTQSGQQATKLELVMNAVTQSSAPQVLFNLMTHLLEDGDMQAIVDTALGTGAKAALSAAAKSNPLWRAGSIGWKVGTGVVVWAWDSCTTPPAVQVWLLNGAVSNIPAPLLKLVIKVDGTEVLRHDDSIDGIRRVLDAIAAPVGSKLEISLTSTQPRLFLEGKNDLAHNAIDGGFVFDVQQPTTLHEALMTAGLSGGGSRLLLHRMLCTRENIHSLGMKQYSQVNMSTIYPSFQCESFTNPLVDFGRELIGGITGETRTFSLHDPAITVVGDYVANFADNTSPLNPQRGFSELTDVYASNSKSMFVYSGTVTEELKTLAIRFTHFALSESHFINVPISSSNRPPLTTLAASWSPSPGDAGPAVGDVVAFAAAALDEDGTVASYAFDFGDGSAPLGVSTTAPLRAVTHAYGAAGAYTATVTVTDNAGAQTSRSVALTVRSNSAPVISQLLPATPLALGQAVTGSLLASDPDDGYIRNLRVHVGRTADASDCQIDIGNYLDLQPVGSKTFSGCPSMTATAGTLYLKVEGRDSKGASAEVTRAVVAVSAAAPPAAGPTASGWQGWNGTVYSEAEVRTQPGNVITKATSNWGDLRARLSAPVNGDNFRLELRARNVNCDNACDLTFWMRNDFSSGQTDSAGTATPTRYVFLAGRNSNVYGDLVAVQSSGGGISSRAAATDTVQWHNYTIDVAGGAVSYAVDGVLRHTMSYSGTLGPLDTLVVGGRNNLELDTSSIQITGR